MRKASKVLFLLAGIFGILTFIGLLIAGIATTAVGIAGQDPTVVAQVVQETQATQEQVLAAAQLLMGFGIFMIIAGALSLVTAIIGFVARSGNKNVLALVFGIIGIAGFGVGAFLLIGGILGMVADKQGQPA